MNPPALPLPQAFSGPPGRSRLERAGGWLIYASAAIACGVALFSFITWWWWQDWRLGASSDTVPMAPNTALILLLLGGALLVRQFWGATDVVRLASFTAAGIAAVPATIMALERVTGIERAWDDLLLRTEVTVRGIPVGHMSPLSAGAFLLAAISLVVLFPPLANRKPFHRAGLVTAALSAFGSIVIALAYASGTPLFYGGSIIPMAFLTAVGLAALNLALLTAAVQGVHRPAGGAGVPRVPLAPFWRAEERNLLLAFGGLALAIAVAGFFFLRAQQVVVRKQIAEQLETMADFKVGQIVSWRNERMADARVLMQDASFFRSAAALFASPDGTAASPDILAHLSSLRRNYGYESVVLFDQRMTPRLAEPPANESSDPPLRAVLAAAPGADDVLVSDLYRGAGGDIRMDVVAPLRDLTPRAGSPNASPTQSAGPPIGAILLRINPRDLLYPLIQKWPGPSASAETLLVRREGDEVVYLNDLRGRPGTALTLRRSSHDRQIPSFEGASGGFGVSEGVDYRGMAVLASVKAVPGSPWIIVAKEDQSEVYAPLRRQAIAVGTIVAMLWLGAAVVGAYRWRHITASFLGRELAAETERRSLAERLALITLHGNDIILLLDEDQRVLEANERALAAYGRTLDEMRQLTVADLHGTAAQATVTQNFPAALTAAGTVFETQHRRKDGTEFPVEVSARLVVTGGRRQVLSIIRDVSDRKRHEDALRLQSAALTAAANAIVIADRDGRVVWANPAFTRMTGYTVADAMGENPPALVRSGENDPDVCANLWETIRRGDGWSGELMNRRKDGSLYPEEQTITPVRNAAGEITHFTAVKQDLTERKLVDRMVQQSRQQFRVVFDQAAVGMVIAEGKGGRIRNANRHFCEMVGYTAAELWQLSSRDITHPDDVAADAAQMQQLNLGVIREFTREKRFRRKDGSAVWAKALVAPLDASETGSRLLIGIFEDITERKRVEAALRESEQKYRELVEHANSIILRWTRDGRITFLNEFGQRFFGFAEAEILGRHLIGTIVPANESDPSDLRGMMEQIGARPEDFEQNINENMRRNGERVWVAWSNRVVRDEQGGVKEILSVGTDITARRQVEAALRLSEERYRLLFDHSPDGIFAVAATGAITALNQAFETITGWPPARWLGRPFLELIHPEDQPRAGEMFRAALSGEPTPASELRVRTAAGGFRDLELTGFSSHLTAGGVEVQGIGRDITERRRGAEALRQSEERYRLLFEDNPLPMWVYDLATLRFLAVNESAVQHYGYTREAFLAMTIKDIRWPEDVPTLPKMTAVESEDSRGTLASRHRRKDGTFMHVELVSRPLVFDGRPARLVLASDITEKKLLEEKFLHAQRLENVGMLAAGIAHDLNNMLAPIVFAAPMLRESLTASRDLKILDILEQSAARGAGLVKQILGFVHSTTSEFRPTQVKHLARDIVRLIEETFPKSIRLEHEVPADLWVVLGNPTQIHQVLLNLCVNARDAMPQGGTLHLTAANCRLNAAGAEAIPGGRPGAWVVFEVSDTSTGIPPELLERIWTPFFTTKGVGKGTGLGLSTVRGIVASHKGFVDLHTAAGRGTTFRVFLPAVETEPAQPGSTAPFDIPDGQGELILLVDDDAAIRDFVSAILRKRGYRVVGCADGVEAMDAFTTHQSEISLVITDVDMPRLGGVALARALLQVCPDIRLLAMSGLSRAETDVSGIPAIKELAHAFLLKPFHSDELLRTVHRLIHPAAAP